jgi:hypothetical protein
MVTSCSWGKCAIDAFKTANCEERRCGVAESMRDSAMVSPSSNPNAAQGPKIVAASRVKKGGLEPFRGAVVCPGTSGEQLVLFCGR